MSAPKERFGVRISCGRVLRAYQAICSPRQNNQLSTL